MEISAAALWLNKVFLGYDTAILTLMHKLAEILGPVLTPLMKLVTLLGEKGVLMFLTGIILMCFPKTRKIGVCVFGAVGCGALITDFILKDAIARPRPFETVEQFRQWWVFVGSPAEDNFSFPSGHVTAIAAGMSALWIWKGRKFAVPSVVTILLMMISRNYLMAHYPSDVLAAVIVGVASAFIAYCITLLIFRFVEEHEDMKVCGFILDFDLRDYLPIEPAVDKIKSFIPAKLIKSETAEERPAKSEKSVKSTKSLKSIKDIKNIDMSFKNDNSGYQGKHLKK